MATEARTQVDFDNLTGVFREKQIVTGSVSGATGTITGINPESLTTGNIIIENYSGTFQNNEGLEVNSVQQATVNITSTPQTIDQQKVVISDPNNPERIQRIDRFGATVNTFNGGSPIFSPYGLLMVGRPQNIRDYNFDLDPRYDSFWDQETNGASIDHESVAGTMVFTNPTTNGSLASRTSHFYHPHRTGGGTLLDMAVAVGDTGKAGVRRRWGLFDDYNGLFWQLDGEILSVVIRSSVSGSVVDTVIEQNDFAEDRLDGTDSLGFSLDVSKGNLYWIDFVADVGRVRFGVYEPNGSRVIAHDFENLNSLTTIPFMQSGTLPIRIEQENTSTSGSVSQMRWTSAAVKRTETSSIFGLRQFSVSNGVNSVTVSDSLLTPIISGRPKTTFNSVINRGLIRLKNVSYINVGANPALIVIGKTLDSLMTNESFTSYAANSIAEIDTSATAVTFGDVLVSRYIAAGDTVEIDLNSKETVHENEIYLLADGVTQPVICWAGQGIGGTTSVLVALNWEEIL